MSKREIQRRRQQRARRQQLTIAAIVGVVAVLVAAWLIYPTLQPVGEFVTVPTEEFPAADGSALGPADAPVVVQVFSDFQ